MDRLRDYQLAAKKAVFEKLATYKSTLIELATGTGKSHIFAHVANEWPGRVLVIAHRDELIRQAAEKISAITDRGVAIEMGKERAEDSLYGAKVTVASIQTICRAERRKKWHPDHHGLIIVDEGHHATATTYREVLDYFASARRLFVTATPKRADQVGLGCICESVAFQYGIEPAIEDGWLVPVKQVVVKVEDLDFSRARTVAEDFNQGDLERILVEEKPLHSMCASAYELCGNKQGLWFCVTVAHARAVASILARYAGNENVAFLSGDTPTDERRKTMDAYRVGKIRHMANCFDDHTEILTSTGWCGIDDISESSEIANWQDGKIFFAPPLRILKRQRGEGERMVVLETPRRSIRVTEGHAMAYRTSRDGKFLIGDARNLVDKICELPVSGHALPLAVKVQQEQKRGITPARIRSNSYRLRKSGMSSAAARAEAIVRVEQRDCLRYADPADITEEECEFIGFWLGDGSCNHLAKGGVEYTLAQSPCYPRIVQRIDALIEAIGVDSIKRRRREGVSADCWIWSFSRGTGFGPQRRHGLYRLEPYLQKQGSDLYWGFDESQFDALVRGWWMADGHHGDCYDAPPTLDFCGINQKLFDLIQAIACCRGYRVSQRRQRKLAKPHHTPLLRMRMRKEKSHRMTMHRLTFEGGWKNEMVWCVSSNTGKVITRRNGSVTVTGQCALFTEGVDIPSTSVVVMGRPTKSLPLYMQCLGRATRPLPGLVDGIDKPEDRRTAIAMSEKPWATVIDFCGNAGRHKIIQATDVLGGKHPPEVRDYAKKTLEEEERVPADIAEALERAKEEMDLLAEEDARRAKITAQVQYRTQEISPFTRQYMDKGYKKAFDFQAPKEKCSDKQAGLIVHLSRRTQSGDWTWKKAKELTPQQARGVIGKLKAMRFVR
jgi:superfamily II DNA or RNA helicase